MKKLVQDRFALYCAVCFRKVDGYSVAKEAKVKEEAGRVRSIIENEWVKGMNGEGV